MQHCMKFSQRGWTQKFLREVKLDEGVLYMANSFHLTSAVTAILFSQLAVS